MTVEDVPRVKQVTVTVEMEDGRVSIAASRPGALNQLEGVRIDRDTKYGDALSAHVDVTLRTSVSWVEQWVESR